jgi:hypothetical protein
MIQRRKPLSRRGAPLRRTALRRVSKKRAKQLREYSTRRERYLRAHPICEVWCSENRFRWINDRTYEQGGLDGNLRILDASQLFGAYRAPVATEIHHTNGRTGDRLTDESFWLAVCRQSHEWIHGNPKKSRSLGFLV